jgi:hypothetical protein
MEDNFSQYVISQIDEGETIFEISQLFGGMKNFMSLVSKYPLLKQIIDEKLGGELEFETDVNDYFKRYKLPVQITGSEKADDFEEMYDIYVDVIIPEVTDESDIAILFNYLHHLEPDYANDWAYFNDRKYNSDMIMTHVVSVNGVNWKDMSRFVNTTVEEVERIIPDKYEI